MTAATLWPYALAAVLLLAAVIVILLVLVLRKSSTSKQYADADEPEEVERPPEQAAGDAADHLMITTGFKNAKAVLKSLSDRRIPRGSLHLVIGAEGSREPGFLARMASSELQLAADDPVKEGLAFGEGCGFYFFEGEGIVLDAAGPQVLAADGAAADAQGWKTLLAELRELRPRRPADGVIVTVSCNELLASGTTGAKISARADRIHAKLLDAQRELGFRLPTYVLVTGCQQLNGFRDLCTQLEDDVRGEMLGWSNPIAAVDAPYRPEWVEEGFGEIHRDLLKLQLDLFATKPNDHNASGGVLLFPWALQTLKKPLATFLRHLFKPSAYQDGMLMRGFYFSGTTAENETAFVSDLLERKIFQEKGLAIPTTSTKMARDRKVTAMKFATAAALVTFTFGLAWAWFKFQRQNEILTPVLQSSEAAVNLGLGHADTRTIKTLLDDMGRIDFQYYGSVFVPSSWFSPFDDSLKDVLSKVFSTVVLDSVHTRLDAKADVAIDEATARIKDINPTVVSVNQSALSADAIVPIEQMSEYTQLEKFVDTMHGIETHGQMLNHIATAGHGDIGEIAEVVRFAFGEDLSRSFFEHGELYGTAIRTATADKFRPEEHQNAASKGAIQLSRDLYYRMYNRNPFVTRLKQLKEMLDAQNQLSRDSGPEKFKYLSMNMRALEADLAGPELQWAFRPDFDLGASFNKILETMNRSRFFGPETVTSIRLRGQSGWSALNLELAAATPYTGSILSTRGGRPEMRLSGDSLALQAAVESYMHEGFVAAPGTDSQLVTSLQQRERMSWNPRLVQQAIGVHQSYERFRDKGLKAFTPNLQAAVDASARERVTAQMEDLLKAAQIVESSPSTPMSGVLEQELQDSIDRFTANAKMLDQASTVFETLGAKKQRNDLVRAMTAEASRLLFMTDNLLERNPPYTSEQADFGWHDAKLPPSPAAWDAKDPAELAAYLEASRTRLVRVARNYAKPLLMWMTDAGTDDFPEHAAMVAKWQSILLDLDDYDAKKPGNAAAAIETYISGPMSTVTMKDCSAAALNMRVRRTNGYLAKRLGDLSHQVTELCWADASHEAMQRYTKIAAAFNDRLAGRFPFTSASSRASRELEADPEDIRRFYRLFDESEPLIRSIPPDTAYGEPLRNARQFLEDMKKARVFFAGFLDPDKAKRKAEVGLEAEFRTLQQTNEKNGNEIIRWALTIGDQTVTDRLSDREKAKKLRWSPGDRVTLALSWATDAPHVPTLPEIQRGVSVDDRTIKYEYEGQWALLYALAKSPEGLRAPEEDVRSAEAPPVTLRLVVLRKAAPASEEAKARKKDKLVKDAEQAGPPAAAKIYMRLAPLAADGTAMDIPYFPSVAPPILGTVMAEAQ